ncbi:MAG: maleylpyruvate isomerase family mycothiol-dependent enzyme [Brachybacterium sp.]
MESGPADVWPLVHTERRRLVEDLANLPRSAWDTASLCEDWSVHDVLAHLLESAMTTRLQFVAGMVRARGDFHRANRDGIERWQRADPQQTLAEYGRAERATRTPPAHPATRLVEVYVHGEDIRRPLSLPGRYPREGIHAALAHQLRTKVSFEGGRERAEGLRLRDSDTGMSWGEGPEVAGPAVDLLLAVSGRTLGDGQLTGPGAATLLARA